MMGYELYRQLSNKKSRKKKGKTHPASEENKEKTDSSLYGKRFYRFKKSVQLYNLPIRIDYKTRRDVSCLISYIILSL